MLLVVSYAAVCRADELVIQLRLNSSCNLSGAIMICFSLVRRFALNWTVVVYHCITLAHQTLLNCPIMSHIESNGEKFNSVSFVCDIVLGKYVNIMETGLSSVHDIDVFR